MKQDIQILIIVSALLEHQCEAPDNIVRIVSDLRNKTTILMKLYRRVVMENVDTVDTLCKGIDLAIEAIPTAVNLVALYQENVPKRHLHYMRWKDIVTVQDHFGYKGDEQKASEELFNKVYKNVLTKDTQ